MIVPSPFGKRLSSPIDQAGFKELDPRMYLYTSSIKGLEKFTKVFIHGNLVLWCYQVTRMLHALVQGTMPVLADVAFASCFLPR